MKLFLIIFLSLSVVASVTTTGEWEKYKNIYPRNFTTPAEEKEHEDEFLKHLAQVREHNELYKQGKVTYRRAINKFADVSAKKVFEGYYGFSSLSVEPNNVKRSRLGYRARVPDSLDWRDKGVSTPVKDQRINTINTCMSCWAFSAVGAMEAQEIIQNYRNITLSEQNIIDCARSTRDIGCYGGHMIHAFNYTSKNKGLSLEMYYEYKGVKGDCIYKPVFNSGSFVTKYKRLPSGDEEALKHAVGTIGPIAAGMDAAHVSLLQYQKGIYYEKDCKSDVKFLGHAVLIVGYGTENGHDYWIVKNSLGKTWGEKGYFRIARNANNHCGIATDALYPLIRQYAAHRIQ